ncbi:30S ribosomal protein S14 [Myxococcota bacterium]|nr:30S ribosomal protein S14 [Myxococcota bacterium]MBU1433166.1 30S ribosomal protein S14 [Myxococcota bacterium]MBU1899715.1 30S ribosomal protein S14 [Myxococcota bacterium]
MAKKSSIAKNKQRRALTAKHAEHRQALIAVIKNPETTLEEKWEAQAKLAKMPRDASATRIVNRCHLTGRARGYYRKFGLSRISLRQEALKGNLPGVVKASW